MTAQEKIRAYIREHRLTRAEAAERFGITVKSGFARVSEWLTEGKGISDDRAHGIAAALGITVHQLFDESETWPPHRVVEHTLLTEPETEVLRVSHWISRRDAEPHRLVSALDRLLSVPGAATTEQATAGPKTPTTGQQEAQDEAAREDGRKKGRRHRGA